MEELDFVLAFLEGGEGRADGDCVDQVGNCVGRVNDFGVSICVAFVTMQQQQRGECTMHQTEATWADTAQSSTEK